MSAYHKMLKDEEERKKGTSSAGNVEIEKEKYVGYLGEVDPKKKKRKSRKSVVDEESLQQQALTILGAMLRIGFSEACWNI